MYKQMELIQRKENEIIKEELEKTKTQLTNLRRGLFGRYDKLVNELSLVQENLSKLEDGMGMKTKISDSKKIVKFPF